LKVLLVNYEYPPIGGGAGNATMFIARALYELGHTPIVLTSAYGGNAGFEEADGVGVHRVKVRRRNADRATSAEMLSFVVAALRSGPEIVSARQIQGVIVFFTLPCGPIALRLLRTRGIPYIVSLRGGDVPGLVPEINLLHKLLAPVRRSVLQHATAVVANDAGLAGLSLKTDSFPVKVIPNGVDSRFFCPSDKKRARVGPTTVLFVGRFHKQKNLPFLLEQMARLQTAAPDGWRLSLVGDGDERAALELTAGRLGLGNVISWHGWQKDKQSLLRLYQQADVVVNPSHYEGMPNVVLEAMGCGLPVVASDIPGNDTLVRQGETGFLFPPGNGDAFRSALQEVRDRPELARSMGESGRRRVEKHFSWTSVASRYLELFELEEPADRA
jgi:glycosyltransferase involved in cell wall biosynthesis